MQRWRSCEDELVSIPTRPWQVSEREEIVLIRLDCQCDNIKFRKLKFEIVKEISKHCQETESR